MNEKIELLIGSAAETGSKNRLSLSQIRQWLSEYLEMYQEDVRRFPELGGKPHADLLMADFDKSRPASFIVGVFTSEAVTFAAGRGDASSIRGFLERELPLDANRILPELASRFVVVDSKVIANRQEVENWLS